MNTIKKEYPEGLLRSEMVLVKMLRENRSWADYIEITDALWNLRFHAQSMRKEHEMLTADTGECQQAMPPNAKSQATDAALSRQVACTDGLGVAVPPAPTFEQGD